MLESTQAMLLNPDGTLKPPGYLTLGLIGLLLAAMVVFSIPLVILPLLLVGIVFAYYFLKLPTWGLITAVFLITIKRLFTAIDMVIPFLTVNRLLVFMVLASYLLNQFVFRKKSRIHSHPQNKITLLFLIWYTISAFLSLNKEYASVYYPQITGNLVLFFLLYQLIDNRKHLGTLFLGFIALLPLSGLLSVVGYRLTGSPIFGSWTADPGERAFRAAGLAGMGPNNYAVVVVISILILTALLWWRDLQRWHRAVIGVFISAYFFMLAQTISRTGMIMFFLATVVFLARFGRRVGFKRLALGALVLMLGASVVVTDQVIDRFLTIGQVTEMQLSEDRSIRNRIGLTLLLPKIMAMNPVFGVGPSNIAYLTSQWEYRDYVGRNPRGVGFVSHNQYVQLLGETGIIGFVIFAGLMVLCIRDLQAARRKLAADEGSFLWALSEGLIMAIPLYFVGAFTLEVANKQAFWIFVAMPIIIRRIVDRETAAPPNPPIAG